jgi:cysteine desulfurase family protein
MIYLDNAATSFPKPPAVADAVRNYMLNIGANPGRSGHRLAASAGRVIFDAREALAKLFNVADSRHIVFTANATESINQVLYGLLRRGDHVVTTSMEHNAVMRPLNHLAQQRNLELSVVAADQVGSIKPGDIAAALRSNTRLVTVNHASNVCGTITPLEAVREAVGKTPLLVDAAQTAGALPIDVERDGVDFLAFTGHKALLGPQGTGGLYIRPGLDGNLEPLKRGGTGSKSEAQTQPEMLPDRYESGTLNAAGLAGLGAGVLYVQKRGVDEIRKHEVELCRMLLDGLKKIKGVQVYGPENPDERTATVSINISGMQPSDVGYALDRRYGIMVRIGLHCAPAAHRSLGTFPGGSVRLGMGAMTTTNEVEETLAALREIAREACGGH